MKNRRGRNSQERKTTRAIIVLTQVDTICTPTTYIQIQIICNSYSVKSNTHYY